MNTSTPVETRLPPATDEGASARCEVLVVGAYFADLIFQRLPRAVHPGAEVFAEDFSILPGGAFNVAMALHRLGHDVVWATDFGTDLFSKHVLAAAREEGLDDRGFRHHCAPVRNVTVVLPSDGDRAMLSYRDLLDPGVTSELLAEYRPRLLVLPALQYGPALTTVLQAARRMGTQVFMDCQDVPADWVSARTTLAEVDIFAPNADEAMRLTGAATVSAAADLLAEVVNTVVVKRGRSGASAIRHGVRHDLPAVPVTAIDTTAAGDCFDAGFLHAHLSGHRVERCLAAGVACGAAASTAPGSSAAPDLAQLRRWLGRIYRQ